MHIERNQTAMPKKVGIIGLGYVGLTLSAALARKGFVVYGVDTSPAVLDSLSRGRPHIFEPGIDEVFASHIDKSIFVGTALPESGVDAAVICVSTPVDPETNQPNLTNLGAAAALVADT